MFYIVDIAHGVDKYLMTLALMVWEKRIGKSMRRDGQTANVRQQELPALREICTCEHLSKISACLALKSENLSHL